MKKKAIKIAASTAVAASAFVAAAPANKADAAVNLDQIVQDAQNAGTVLKWAISVEGSADYVTRPYDTYNAAKKAIDAAEKALKGASTSDKLKYEARLTEPKIQVKRAQAYIDAITSSEKIKELTANLNAAVKSDDIEKVEAAYHKATAEYRKQSALLDRVYGQSTRDGIRNAVKPALEKLVAELKNDVTVNMLAKAAAADVKAGKVVDAGKKVAEAQAILDANVLKWETNLQKSVNDVVASLPLSVVSVSSLNKTTVVVKLNKEVNAVSTSQFVFNNDLAVTGAVLGSDGKTVTLTTTTQKDGTTYTVTYNGTTASFTTAPSTSTSLVTVDGSEIHKENGENVALKAVFKEATGETSQAAVDVLVPTGFTVTSIQGLAPVASTSTATAGYNTYAATPNASGEVSVILNSGAVATDAYESGKVTFKKMFNGSAVESKTTGKINFYQVLATDTLSNAVVDYVDAANNYFVSGGKKYFIKNGDALYNEQSSSLSRDEFKAALNKGDTVTSTVYSKDSASDFRITFNKVNADFAFADKFLVNNNEQTTGYYRLDDSRITLEGKGQPGYTVHVFNKTTGIKLGTATVNSAGTWSFTTNVDQNAVTVFGTKHLPAGVSYTFSAADVDTLNVLEGAFDFTAAISATAGAVDGSLLGDTLTITPTAFAAPVFTDDLNVASGASIVLADGDGTKLKFVKNSSNTWTVAAGVLDITFSSSFTTIANGATPGLQGALTIESIDGVTNDYGVTLNVKPSTHVINGGTY